MVKFSFFYFCTLSFILASFDSTIDPLLSKSHCSLSSKEQKAILHSLERNIEYRIRNKTVFNYNIEKDRLKKHDLEQNNDFYIQYFAYQQSAYRLGVLLSGTECSPLNYKKAHYYYSLAGRKPETYWAVAQLNYRHFQHNHNQYYLDKALDLFLKSFDRGNKKAYYNILWLQETYYPHKLSLRYNLIKKAKALNFDFPP